MADVLPESRESLWWLTAGPVVWALHFLGSYGTVAVWCAKVAGRDGGLGDARVLVGVYTVVALGIVGFVAARGYRRHTYGGSAPPHDFDTAADRHRFLGFATLLLAWLSAVAIVYDALTIVFIGSCR